VYERDADILTYHRDCLYTTPKRKEVQEVDDIFDKFRNLQAEMELFFDDFFRLRHPFALGAEKKWRPSVDVYETKGELVVIAELAGISREDINVSASEKAIYISGTRKEVEGYGKKYYHSMEIRFGAFERLIPLSAKVDLERMEVTLENGLLTIRLPKALKQKEIIVEIE
jgi:HSP20 family protein